VTPLPVSLIDKVASAALEVDPAADVAPGLAKLLEMELTPDEQEYVLALGRAVLRAILDARPR
jgi:hypothetical protein